MMLPSLLADVHAATKAPSTQQATLQVVKGKESCISITHTPSNANHVNDMSSPFFTAPPTGER